MDDEKKPVRVDYENVVGQDDLTRFDAPKSKNRNRNKSNNRHQGNRPNNQQPSNKGNNPKLIKKNDQKPQNGNA